MTTLITDLRAATLAAVERDAAQPTSEPPPLLDISAEREGLLARLRAANGVAEQEIVLREIERHAMTLDALSRACMREEMITILGKHGCSAPARVTDAALGPVVETRQFGPSEIVRTVEPSRSPVDGAALLDDIASTVGRHVVLPAGAPDAVALWTLHTYVYDSHVISPRLALLSPEKRCGKTTLLALLGEMCDRPLSAANLTAAVMFRVIESARPTLLIDEADTFVSEARDLIGIINAGHRHDGRVLRCDGESNQPRAFACYAPLALAAIGRLPGTVVDRSIVVPMRRRGRDEHAERLRLDRVEPLRDLARRSARWGRDHAQHLDRDPVMPEALHDRARDNWRVLVSIAERAGGDWPLRARAAALSLSVASSDDDSARVMLLADIRTAFDVRSADRLATSDLLQELHGMEDRSWGDSSNGRPMTPHALGRQLRPFKIAPRQWRDGAVRERGYERADFDDAWKRYL